jgi:UDP-glucose 4-epimerase
MPSEPLTILITGGAGYVGAASADALIAAGHRIVILDDLSTGHVDLIPNEASAISGSYTDRERVGDLIRDARIDAILHCAARSIVSDSVEHPERYYRDNLIGSLNLLDAAVSAGIKRIVFSSSAAVYGAAQGTVLNEETPVSPINPYGATKAAFEHAMRSYAGAYGAQTFAMRYFNVAGATERVREQHNPETHLLPRIIHAALNGETFSVFGTDYATPDGTALRDYVHVADVAAAHVAAFGVLSDPARLAKVPAFTALNIGSGVGTSVRQAISAVERATGTTLAVEPGPRRVGDPPSLVADVTRAAASIGWRPRQSDIGRIVRSLVPSA